MCDSCTYKEGRNWQSHGHLGVIGSSLVITDCQVHLVCCAGAQESPIRVRSLVHLAQESASEGPKGCTMGAKLSSLMQFYGLGLSEKLSTTQWHSNVSRFFLHPIPFHTWDLILRGMDFILSLTLCEHFASFYLSYTWGCRGCPLILPFYDLVNESVITS